MDRLPPSKMIELVENYDAKIKLMDEGVLLIKAKLEEAKSKRIELQNGKQESSKTPTVTQNTVGVMTSDL